MPLSVSTRPFVRRSDALLLLPVCRIFTLGIVAVVCSGLDGLHNGVPVVILNLEIKGFFGSVLDGTLSRCHFVSAQARYHPLQALV